MAISISPDSDNALVQINFSRQTYIQASARERLNSGLRVNHNREDTVTLALANRLAGQALHLGQAAKNAADGSSILEIADHSLNQASTLLTEIKSRASQGTSASLSSGDRRKLQGDLVKLIQELDQTISGATFNRQPLLTGAFSNRAFQVGPNPGDQLQLSLDSANLQVLGRSDQAELSLTNRTGATAALFLRHRLSGDTLAVSPRELKFNNSAANGMGGLAEAVNALSASSGITARAVVQSTSSSAVQAGTTEAAFAINGIAIGAVAVQALDAGGQLTAAINQATDAHGVTATIGDAGLLQLLAADGRPIEITGLGTVLAPGEGTALSTFGHLLLLQAGAYLVATSETPGLELAFASNLALAAPVTTTIDSALAANSLLGATSTLSAGWTTGATIGGSQIGGDIVTSGDSLLKAGTVLAPGSIVASGTLLGGNLVTGGDLAAGGVSLLAGGSVLLTGSTLAAGTYLTTTVNASGGSIAAGTTLASAKVLDSDATLGPDLLLAAGSIIKGGSQLTAGSALGTALTLAAPLTLSTAMNLLAASTIIDSDGVTSLAAGSTIGGPATVAGDVTLLHPMTVKSGSTLALASSLATGSTLGGNAILNGAHTSSQTIALAAGAIIASGSILKAGTILTNPIVTTVTTLAAGTTLDQEVETLGSNPLPLAMSLASGSILADGSTLTPNLNGRGVQKSGEATIRLRDLKVDTVGDAQTAVALADAAENYLGQQREETARGKRLFSGLIRTLEVAQFHTGQAQSRLQEIEPERETANYAQAMLFAKSGPFALAMSNLMHTNRAGTVGAWTRIDLNQQVYILGRMQSLLQPTLFASSQANANTATVTALLQGGENKPPIPALLV